MTMIAQNKSNQTDQTMDQVDVATPTGGEPKLVTQDGRAIYGSFWLDDTEFALPVVFVQEVINEPSGISAVPLTQPFVLGLFNLRGKIIPVVDLRSLLEFPPNDTKGKGKVAIIEHGELCIGLLFDKTGEILNEEGASRLDFNSKNKEMKDVVIDGLLKLEDGERIVQILDPYEVLKIDKFPRTEKVSDLDARKSVRGKRLNCISFQVGHTSCALDLRHVREVNEMPQIDTSLMVNGCVIGTTNLRGTILPVVDLRNFLGDEANVSNSNSGTQGRKLLVLSTDSGLIGLMVYSIDSIIPYFEDEMLPFAKLALIQNEIVKGCLVDKNNDLVMMLDYNNLKSDPELNVAASSCHEAFTLVAEQEEGSQEATGNRRQTFILFTIENRYALDISQVSEVINCPETLIKPPFSLSFVEGIINLRREMITLINPRLLYGLPDEKKGDNRVLIFTHKNQKYGILVDSVDEIVMTMEKNVAQLTPLDQMNTSRDISKDVTGCLQDTSGNADNKPTMILDVASLVSRCLQTPQ